MLNLLMISIVPLKGMHVRVFACVHVHVFMFIVLLGRHLFLDHMFDFFHCYHISARALLYTCLL